MLCGGTRLSVLVFLVQESACKLARIDETGDSCISYLIVWRMVLPDNDTTELAILKSLKSSVCNEGTFFLSSAIVPPIKCKKLTAK